MKKLFSLFAALLFVGTMWAANVSVTFSSWSTSVNTYSATEWSDKGCTFTFANNNQKNWEYVRCGGKNSSGSSTIKYNSKVTVPVSSVVLSTPNKISNGTSSAITITGIEVAAYSDAGFSTLVSSKNLGTLSYVKNNCPESFTITPTTAWAKDLYYKITISWTATGSNNCGLNISSMTFTEAADCDNSITITKADNPAKGTFTIDNSGTVCIDEGNASVTVTANPVAHYHLSVVTSKDGNEDPVGTVGTISENSCTITGINASTTIAVEFEEDTKFAVNWYANGSLIETLNYYEDSQITGHAAPAALASNYEDKMFIGWVETPIDGEAAEKPALANFPMDAAAKTFYALYATATKTADASLTKQGSSASFAANDNIVIVAGSYALYQETTNSSYVKNWSFENSAATVGTNDKNYVTLKAVPEKTTFYLGDGSNGYLYNGSSNNLEVSAENSTEWAIAWNNTESKFTIIGNSRWLACRTDLTSSNKNLFRMGGATSGDPSGTVYFDIYKFVPAVYSYSAYVTTVPKKSAPINWPNATASAYTVGKANTWQTLNNDESLTVVYSSTNTNVATISNEEGHEGEISLVAAGTTTIKATYAADVYKGTVVEYTLNVYDPEVIIIDGTCQTAYEKGDAFDRTGLVATAIYGDSEEFDVTDLATWTNDLTDNKVDDAGDVTVTAAWQGLDDDEVVTVSLLKHTITFNDPENGSLTVRVSGGNISSGAQAYKGETITIVATPDKGYKIASVTANDEPLVGEDGNYSYNVGTEDVAIVASFEIATGFEDVETSVKAVKVLRDGQIFILRGDKTFNAQGQLVK